MENRQNILNEIYEISPVVANIGNSNLYSVPSGYFDNLVNEITAKINGGVLLQNNSVTPFRVPPGYFDGLAGNILTKIKSEEKSKPLLNEVAAELEEIAPLLNTISRKNIYTVPQNYFESFSVNKTLTQTVPAKIVSIGSKTRKWFMYAAAAVLIGIIATGSILFISNKKVTVKTTQSKIAAININDSLARLSDAAIANYLDTQPTAFDVVTPSQNDYDPDVQDLLNNASDSEIQQYLKDNPDPTTKKIKGI